MIEILTIINTCILIYILTRKYFSFHKCKTIHKSTLVGICIYFKQKLSIYIPIRNEEKTNLKEDVDRMLSNSKEGNIQQLRAMFSWIKTNEEAEQFKKDYSIVDRAFVQELVNGFEPESNH